ncbi:hypothetical protein VUR80DRAFT_2409 [Thermomyces stellatus]
MHFQLQDANGAAPSPSKFTSGSSTLPFGQKVPLSHISGPTYVTAQLLVQQIAYKLSDKIFSYSPETFDLDVAARDWAAAGESNVHGYATSVVPLQARIGAGAFALGYIFSPDFDLSKRHIPQTLLAASGSLRHLRASLDQLSLLYGVSSPLVAHVAAADYSANNGLIAEYDSVLRIAEDLGLGLVSSFSTYEAQHMALLSTLMANLVPTLHVYDGVRMTRETLRVVDALGENGISDLYSRVSKGVAALNKRLDTSGKVVELVRAFNDELGTAYDLFEYTGHSRAEIVLVVFGSTEAQLASAVVGRLAEQGAKVGLVKVRVYRPFVDEEFLKVLPESVRDIIVVGQVVSDAAVTDASEQSSLYGDVLAAITFSGKFATEPKVTESKYSASTALAPRFFADVLSKATGVDLEARAATSLKADQYTFWDTDDSPALGTPTAVGSLFSKKSTDNIYVHETYDNLVQGGVVRTDIRSSKKAIEAPYHVDEADVIVVGEEKLLRDIAISKSVKKEGSVIVKLPNFKEEDAEKRLPVHFRKEVQEKKVELYALDASASPELEDAAASRLLLELAFIRIARPDTSPEEISKLILAAGSQTSLEDWVALVNTCLRKIEVPATWAEVPEDAPPAPLRNTVKPTAFTGFNKEEPEEELQLTNWQTAAKGLAFKEAYGTRISLRPDLSVKTSTITVKENRRLTPDDYDRNIFHIEFDLGDSGLTYKIGEALGVHAENDKTQVEEFIEFYGLNPDDLVSVPSRDDPAVLETRTVYQSLVQNVDIFGKPPKRFYESLAEFATDEAEKAKLASLGSAEGAEEFKRRSEVDTVTYVDILEEFPSARPSFHDLVRIVGPLQRREYSIASAQAVSPNSVALMIVVVNWTDTKGRLRTGQATNYLSRLPPGAKVTVSVKPSVMKLPASDKAPLIMAGLGTGLAPFRAFVQYRAMQKAQGKEIGSILLYLGSRHQREEYLYGEEWEAYLDAGVITHLGAAFSRDQPQKIYIQDRMRQSMSDIIKAYIKEEGSFYLCGPTWPVPDVTEVLEEAIREEAKMAGRKVNSRTEIEQLKEAGRYVLEVY